MPTGASAVSVYIWSDGDLIAVVTAAFPAAEFELCESEREVIWSVGKTDTDRVE